VPATTHPLPPYPAPPGRTVRRVEWSFLPPAVRDGVERRLGSPVVAAVSQRSGFTPGLASVLTCADGSHHFVKAASVRAQAAFAGSYRDEASALRALPSAVPAPGLCWAEELQGWFVLETAYVEARAPQRPWCADELEACLALLARTAEVLTPAPPDTWPTTLAQETATWPAGWDALAARWSHPQLSEAAALAARHAEALAGETVVHGDVRPDNLLLTGQGEEACVLLCDWTWPARGAAWVDALTLLVGAHGDGLDAQAVVAAHPTFDSVPTDSLDVALALLAGHDLASAGLRAPPTSPWLREHQRWHGTAAWSWLCLRRGWDPDLGGLAARC